MVNRLHFSFLKNYLYVSIIQLSVDDSGSAKMTQELEKELIPKLI